jgi:hypothetical protein
MITKADIVQMVKRVHRESRGLPPRRLIYPAREWAIGVVLTIGIILIVCAVSGYTYLYLTDIQTRIEPVTPTTVRYQEQTVARALELYELRADRFAVLQPTAPAAPLEPALATSTETAIATSTPVSTTATGTATVDESVTEVETQPATSSGQLQVF